jgi:anti-anti-sigma factor
MPPMSPTCDPQNQLVLRFQGCMDTAKCGEIEADVRTSLADADQPVVFDLDAVDFVSSSFLRLCIIARRQASPNGFQIVNVCPMVKRVFKIAGLDGMLA